MKVKTVDSLQASTIAHAILSVQEQLERIANILEDRLENIEQEIKRTQYPLTVIGEILDEVTYIRYEIGNPRYRVLRVQTK